VGYPLRFSGPVTALTARRVRHGVEADLICQPGTSPDKDALVPRRFSNNSLPPFFPLTLHLPAPPHPVVPQAAPSSTYSLRLFLSHRTDTMRPVEKCRSVTSWLLFARRLGSIIPSTVWPVRRPLHNDAGEAPGVPAGRRRLSHATALNAGLLLLPFKLRLLIHHTLRLHRGRLRPRQLVNWLRYRCVITTSSC
jgi:hypothetical protein